MRNKDGVVVSFWTGTKTVIRRFYLGNLIKSKCTIGQATDLAQKKAYVLKPRAALIAAQNISL